MHPGARRSRSHDDDRLWSRFPASVTIWDTAPNVSALDDDHAGILDAIRTGDAERAGALMSAHVRHAGKLRAGAG